MPDDPLVRPLLDEPLDSNATLEHVGGSCIDLPASCRMEAGSGTTLSPVAETDSRRHQHPSAGDSLPSIPGYEMEAVLGMGGMGVVFRARHLRLDRVVALKVNLAGAYAGPNERERFQREAEAVAALRHPNVVQGYDIGDDGGRPYFTMEDVEGGSLAVCLKCLHKEPSRRYLTAAALADDLGRFRRGEAMAARPDGQFARFARQVRRRPVLSSAVAVATLSMATLVGGGAWTLAERAAAARAAEAKQAKADAQQSATEQAADEDLTEATESLKQASWSGARAALERVKGRLGDSGPVELRRRLDRGIRDLQLGERLEEIRVDGGRGLAGFGLGRCDEAYEAEFRGAGIGPPNDDPQVVAGRVRESSISNGLLAALDHWSTTAADLRRGWIRDVARRADRNPTGWRDRARDPDVRADAAAFTLLVETAPVATQPAALLLALDNHLDRRSKGRLPFLERVQRSHPDDFWATITLGNARTQAGKPGEAIRYFQAAVAIRPRLALGYHHLGFNLSVTGRTEEAVEPVRRAVTLDPASPPTVHMLAFVLS